MSCAQVAGLVELLAGKELEIHQLKTRIQELEANDRSKRIVVLWNQPTLAPQAQYV